jgi:hypothetical protein
MTGKENTMDLPITDAQIGAWQAGLLIQLAMPELTPAQREFVKSGYIESDWAVLTQEDDDELPPRG